MFRTLYSQMLDVSSSYFSLYVDHLGAYALKALFIVVNLAFNISWNIWPTLHSAVAIKYYSDTYS